MTCKSDEHVWKLLYQTNNVRVYRCDKCSKDVYEEAPFAGKTG